MRRRIAEITEVRTGYPFRGRVVPDPGGNARVVQIRDLDDAGRVRVGQLVRVKAVHLENYRFRPGDVLFLARGVRRLALPVPDHDDEALIAASYFFILRPRREVEPAYLIWAINQPDFQEAMRTFVKGSTLPQITKADLLDLPIDVPLLSIQRQIVVVHDLLERERRLTEELREKRATLLRAVARGSSQPTTARKASS